MRGNAQHFQAQESGASAKARLAVLLACCTPERLASFSADSLAATHRVKFADVTQMLAQARDRRAEQARRDRA